MQRASPAGGFISPVQTNTVINWLSFALGNHCSSFSHESKCRDFDGFKGIQVPPQGVWTAGGWPAGVGTCMGYDMGRRYFTPIRTGKSLPLIPLPGSSAH